MERQQDGIEPYICSIPVYGHCSSRQDPINCIYNDRPLHNSPAECSNQCKPNIIATLFAHYHSIAYTMVVAVVRYTLAII